jgi:hypothetical protein
LGCFSSYVTEVGVDSSGLGRWLWLYVGGGGENTQLITAYQPYNPWKKTQGKTVWDQQLRYFKSLNKIRNPRLMFKADLLNLLWRWKAAGNEVLLLGNFNKDVYSGSLASQLSSDKFQMTKMCLWTTGNKLPSTHIHGQMPINGVFATCGLVCKAVTLLPSRERVGDHRVFVLDIVSESVLGNAFSWVIPISHRLLNCASDWIKQNFISLLNQLANIGTTYSGSFSRSIRTASTYQHMRCNY